jgi:hypothetical protein
VCGFRRGIEASHTGSRGIGQKSSDLSAIPLCHRHHRTGGDSYHKLGQRRFAEVHNLDIPDIVRRLGARPVIHVESGAFVGYLNDQQFVLGFVRDGVAPAVKKMMTVSREDRLPQPMAS